MRKLVVVAFFWLALSPPRAEAWNPLKAAADKLKAAGRAVGAAGRMGNALRGHARPERARHRGVPGGPAIRAREHGQQMPSDVRATIDRNYQVRKLRLL